MMQDPLDTLSVYQPNVQTRRLTAIEQLSQVRYIFNPDNDLSMRNRNVGFDVLPRVRLMPIVNHTVLVQADPMGPADSRVREHTIYAQYLAVEIASVYAHLGVIEVEEFTGIPPNIVRDIQKTLMPEVPTTTTGLCSALDLAISALESQQYSEFLRKAGEPVHIRDLEAKCLSAYHSMHEAAQRALRYQTDYMTASVEDRKNYVQSGKMYFDERDQKYAKLLNMELPDVLPDAQDQTVAAIEKALQANSGIAAEQVKTLVTEIVTQIFERTQAPDAFIRRRKGE